VELKLIFCADVPLRNYSLTEVNFMRHLALIPLCLAMSTLAIWCRVVRSRDFSRPNSPTHPSHSWHSPKRENRWFS